MLEHEETVRCERSGFEARLAQAVPALYPLLRDAACYSLLAPGKRVRPLLLLLCGGSLGVEKEKLYPWAEALEMIHCYSLIHDDLPAMDDDDYRRGRLTNHKVYGEGQAILAGDGLQSLAFQTASEALAADPGPGTARAMKLLAEAALGMVCGQSADLVFEEKKAELSDLQYIERNKTGCLLTAPLTMAGALAGVGAGEQERLERAGRALGTAFQIYDDVLDVEGSFEELGKPIGSDRENGKSTFVSAFGLEKAKEEAERLTEESVGALSFLPGEYGEALREFVRALITRRN